MFLQSLNLTPPSDAISEPIPKEKILEGDPQTVSWALETPFEGLYCGVWCCTEGAFSIQYDEWEYCHIHAGLIEITADDGKVRRFAAGDEFVLEPGFIGVWRTIISCQKTYVIKTP